MKNSQKYMTAPENRHFFASPDFCGGGQNASALWNYERESLRLEDINVSEKFKWLGKTC